MLSRLSRLGNHFIIPRRNMSRRADGLISTAGCIIIGDEVLGGKTHDTNSNFFAKYCFELGISLKKIEIIPDDEQDIMESVRRMSSAYDIVVTSGGIGPTHDDITYASIGKAFSLPLTLHEDAFDRMKRLSKPNARQPNFSWDTPSEQLTARKRMIELPLDQSSSLADQVLFVDEKLWVPICIVNGNVHILPGVPRLFEQLLNGYKPRLQTKLATTGSDYRVMISTPMPESEVASYLTKLAQETGPKGVKVGSYPRWGKNYNTVTLVGKDREYIDSIVAEVEKNVEGKRFQPGELEEEKE